MERLNENQKREIIGGKTTGSFLSGIGSIVKAGGDFVVNMFGAISTTVFANKVISKTDKMELKIGNSSLKFDNSISAKAESHHENHHEKIKEINPADSLIDLF